MYAVIKVNEKQINDIVFGNVIAIYSTYVAYFLIRLFRSCCNTGEKHSTAFIDSDILKRDNPAAYIISKFPPFLPEISQLLHKHNT